MGFVDFLFHPWCVDEAGFRRSGFGRKSGRNSLNMQKLILLDQPQIFRGKCDWAGWWIVIEAAAHLFGYCGGTANRRTPVNAPKLYWMVNR